MTTRLSSPAGQAFYDLPVGADTFPCLDIGQGPPVLWLHGAPGDFRLWNRQCERLADRFRCISFTQRWFGTTTWREDGPPFGTGHHAADLVAVCETIGLGPVNLVAWSYAGHVALLAALARPDLFAKVLIYEPGFPTYVSDPGELADFGKDAEAMFGPIFEAVGHGDLEAAVRRLYEGSGGPGAFDRQSEERRRIALDNAPVLPRLLAQEPPPAIGCDDLARLKVPVSIAWGACSRPVFKIPSRAATRCIPTGSHREIPDADHLWPDDDPDGFAAFVAAWLDGEA